MNEVRLQFIPQIVKNLKSYESERFKHISFDEICKARALFGKEIPEMEPLYQECVKNVESSARNAGAIAILLEEHLIRQKGKCATDNNTLIILKPYKIAYRHYSNGLAKYQDGIYERNTLDDMRAALESLVREITGKEKTLENQVSIICTMLDEHGVKPEIRNLFQKTLDYFTKYQNNYVKHNDEVDPAEVSFVIEWTGVLMKYIINMLG